MSGGECPDRTCHAYPLHITRYGWMLVAIATGYGAALHPCVNSIWQFADKSGRAGCQRQEAGYAGPTSQGCSSPSAPAPHSRSCTSGPGACQLSPEDPLRASSEPALQQSESQTSDKHRGPVMSGAHARRQAGHSLQTPRPESWSLCH